MLFDTSIKDKETKRKIEELVGKPFSFFEMLKIGSIGSSRMRVKEYSKLFNSVMQWDKHNVHANIALRPKGIIIVLPIRLNNYSWVIPYHYLSVFKTEQLVIHGQGEFLKLDLYNDQNQKLINKVLHYKQLHCGLIER